MSNLERNQEQQQSQFNELINSEQTTSKVTHYSQKAILKALDDSSFLKRLFPDERQRAAIQGELELIKTEYEKAKRFLEIVRETQIQSLTETCNQYLKQGKGEVRANVHKYLLQKTKELTEEMDDIMADSLQKWDEKIQQLDTIKSPKIREIREQQLNRDIEYFAELQHELMTRFKKIVSEGV